MKESKPMTAKDILTELKGLGSDSIKKVLLKHGAREPFYGVKVEDLKKIQKRVKKDYKTFDGFCTTPEIQTRCTLPASSRSLIK